MGFATVILKLLLVGNVAVVTANNCWQTTVTVHYTVGPSTISVSQNEANNLMNEVLSVGKGQLSCSGLTLKLLSVTIGTPGNLYSISGSFGVIYGNMSANQKQTAKSCLTRAVIFNNVVLRPDYYTSPLKGSHWADRAVLTNFQDTTCSINGVQSTIRSTTALPVVPTSTGTFPVKPPPPRNIRIPEKGTKFMRIEWEQPLNWIAYRIQKYIIWYKKRTSSDFNNRIKMDNNTFSKTIEGLEVDTRYDFQMYSENSIGQGPSSSVISAVTLSARGHSQGQESGVNLTWLWIFLALLLVIAVFVLVVYRYKKRENPIPDENNIRYEIPEIENPFDPYQNQLNPDVIEMMPDKWKEIPRSQLILGEKLGSGEFGMVKKGILQLENGNITCAIKMLKATAGEEERRDLLNELEILTEVGAHENLVNLIGACTREGPIFIVLEFAEGGSLINYLQSNVMMIADRELVCSLPDKEKIQIGLDIAKGMQHLAHVKCVHRDLAARNVLLTGNKRAKVADFGMSRDVYETGIYERATRPTKVPVRWLAPEAVKDYMFTTKGDIWSYGVVLWEIESGGKEPYGDPPKHISVVDYVVNYLYQGQRLLKPGRCRQEIYNVMLQCWQMDPNKRPSFNVICVNMEALLQQAMNLGNCTTHSSMA